MITVSPAASGAASAPCRRALTPLMKEVDVPADAAGLIRDA
jgi:hypothetical protein